MFEIISLIREKLLSLLQVTCMKIESADPRQQSEAEDEAELNGADASIRHCCYSELNPSSV